MIKSTTFDKIAILLSGICLLHCLLLPIILTLLPIVAANSLFSDLLFHQLILLVIIPSSSIALFIGCRKHRNNLIAVSGIIGMSLLVFIAIVGHSLFTEFSEKLFTCFAGALLAYSHILNYRACQATTCNSKHCKTEHHH